MKTSHAQRKGAQHIEQHKFDRSKAGTILRDTGPRKLQAKHLLGQQPLYNANVCWVSDPFEGKLYMVYGCRPGKENCNVPTSDFFSLDKTTKKWKNLTESLVFRKPESPFSETDCKREQKELPQLTHATCTLFRKHDTSFLLIFGGYDVDAEEPSHELIVINLCHLEWWYQSIQGGPVAGRIGPTMVGNGTPHASYSICSLSDSGTWHWEECDVPYPQNVPLGSIFGNAVPVYNGTKILLTPWRTTHMADKDYIHFTEENIFCFHIERRKFQSVDVAGNFPQNLEWFYTFSLDHLRKPGPGLHNPGQHPSSSTASTAPTGISSALSSAIICGWANWVGSINDPTPELWHLELTPTERIRKVDIGPMVHEVGLSFEGAALLGDQLLLLGSNADSEDYDYEAALNPDAKYDRYLEIPL